MKKFLVMSFMLLLLVLSACGQEEGSTVKTSEDEKSEELSNTQNETKGSIEDYPQFMEVQKNEKLVLMETTKGTIKIRMFPEYAPKAVENFLTHAKNGYYYGVTFHRVINDFMIQGGDPKGDGTGGESIWGKPFEDEFSVELFHFRGALSMANAGTNTNGSQFFIVQNNKIDHGEREEMIDIGYPEEIVDAYMKEGGTHSLDYRHTVFGQVVEGMEVVDEIASVETDDKGKPSEDVIIKSIKMIK